MSAESSGQVIETFTPIELEPGLYWFLSILNDNTIRLPITSHTGWGEIGSLLHGGPIGASTTVYQGGFSSTDSTPPPNSTKWNGDK